MRSTRVNVHWMRGIVVPPMPAPSHGRAAACFVALLLLSACVGTVPATVEPSGTPSGPTPVTGTSIPSTPTSPPAPITPPPDNNPVATILAWIVGLGPGSPEGPDEVDAYQLILEASEDGCRAAFQAEMPPESVDLYHGAAAACLAALHGKSARWDDAQAAYDALHGPPDGCLD